jgi:hypothetical protein
MKAYRIERFGSVDGIELRSSDDPRPGPKEVLMRVRASSLNYRDLMVLKGGGRGPTKLGVVPLSDGAGDSEMLRQCRTEQQMIDSETGVAREGVTEILPERINSLTRMQSPQRVGPALL